MLVLMKIAVENPTNYTLVSGPVLVFELIISNISSNSKEFLFIFIITFKIIRLKPKINQPYRQG